MGWPCSLENVLLGVIDELIEGFGFRAARSVRGLGKELPFQLLLDQLLFSIGIKSRNDLLILDEFHAVLLCLFHHFEGLLDS